MTKIGDDELIIPSVLVLPRLDIERRYLFRIPETRIHPVVDHRYLLVGDAVDKTQRIHGILGYAVIEVIRESEYRSLEKPV